MKYKVSLFFLFHVISFKSHCYEINVQNASLVDTIKITDKISLIYNSRSTNRWSMGQGWCLSFEKQIIRLSESKLNIDSCEKPYQQETFTKKNDVYINDTNPNDILLFDKNNWLRINHQKTIENYDPNGRIIDSKKNSFQIKRDPNSGLPAYLISQIGVIQLKFFKNYLSKISFPNNKIVYSFIYDQNGNLRKKIKNNYSVFTAKYEINSDRVVSLNEKQCSLQFLYLDIPVNNSFLVKTNRICKGQAEIKMDYQFIYQKIGEKKVLKKLIKTSNNRVERIAYEVR